jgi:NAD(P)-dependent dehydrogenase (short-subunit alcohol dehydrogenase family)
VDVKPGVVLVTGASTGIGRTIVTDLAASGVTVFAGVRDASAAPTTDGPGRIHPLLLDVTDHAQVAAAGAAIRERIGPEGMRGVVNNAGIGIGGPLEFIPMDEMRRQFEVNLFGQLAVTQAVLGMLREHGDGRVVYTSSIGGRVAGPMVGPYAASKHALNGMAESLRRELRPWNIQVSVLAPAAVATPIWDKGAEGIDDAIESIPPEGRELYGGSISSMRKVVADAADRAIPPQRVAAAARHALYASRPKAEYLIGLEARSMAALSSALPHRVFDAMVAKRTGTG